MILCSSLKTASKRVVSLVLLAAGLLTTGLLALTASAQGPDVAKPNIIFIMADDLGYGHVGCYGQKFIETPHMDRLAAEGMRFTQAYAGSNVCAPSRSTLLTGQHTGHTPIRANGGGKFLYPEDVTTAEIAKRAGYATGGFGKWGLGIEGTDGAPTRQGFDEFFGYLHQVHAHFFYPYYLSQDEGRFMLPENEGRRRERYSHDETHAQAMNFIRKHRDEPFYCYVPYTIPHVELVVPEASFKRYQGRFGPETPLPDPRRGYIGADEPLATYAGMVSHMDDDLGEMMQLLADLDLDERTIVFFTSDNGPQGGAWQRLADFFDGNGPLRGYKGEFYEGGIREPFIVRWPGHIAAGSTSDHVCAFWDMLPTVADLVCVEPPEGIDGISIVPTLLGEAAGREQEVHEYLYWEYPAGDSRTQAVRWGDWKAIRPRANGPLELYDLSADVGETKDVAATHPGVMAKISEILSGARTEMRDYPVEVPRPTVDSYVR